MLQWIRQLRAQALGAGCLINPTTSPLWVTREADSRDIVLHPGQRMAIPRGKTIVQSLDGRQILAVLQR